MPEKHPKSTKKSGKPAKAKSLALAENKADILCYEARKNQKKRPFDDVMRQWAITVPTLSVWATVCVAPMADAKDFNQPF